MALSNKEAQKTPLRLRRLSIENSMKPEDKSGIKSPSYMPRSRRLSLEGSKSTIKKDTIQPKNVTDVSKTPQLDSVQKKHSPTDAVPKQSGHSSNSSSKLELQNKGLRSPTSIKSQKRVIKIDCAAQVHPLKLPETPEPQGFNKIARIDVAASMDFHTPNVASSINGKGSQIRRSLRTTIGKLINGQDKRCVK